MANSQFETASASPQVTWIRVLQKVLEAIGVPVVAWLVGSRWQSLADYAKTHPFKVLGLFALYEAIVLIGGFVTEVWQRIRHQLVDVCVD